MIPNSVDVVLPTSMLSKTLNEHTSIFTEASGLLFENFDFIDQFFLKFLYKTYVTDLLHIL